MIKTELLRDGTLIKHYSDKNVMLLQNETGVMYSDPIDLVPCAYTYSEADIPIESAEEETTEEQVKALAYDIITGVSE
jgi:hypothetical protein